MSLEHCGRCLFWPSLLLVALNLAQMRPGMFQEHYALCDHSYYPIKNTLQQNFLFPNWVGVPSHPSALFEKPSNYVYF